MGTRVKTEALISNFFGNMFLTIGIYTTNIDKRWIDIVHSDGLYAKDPILLIHNL